MLEWMIVSREIEICKGRGFGEKTVSEDWGSRVSNFQSAAARRMPTMLWHWHGSAGAHRFFASATHANFSYCLAAI
jgi:hypothetical protein